MLGVEHHHDRNRPGPAREVRIHDIEIGVAGKDPQINTSRFSKTRDQWNDAETIAAPVLTQHQDPYRTRRTQSLDLVSRNSRRPVHPLPHFVVFRDRRQVLRKPRRGLVACRIDRERHRDGVTPMGRSDGGREYESVTVSVWFRSTSFPFDLKMTCSRNPISVRQLRVRR